MRTTIDLPEDLFREAKTRAVQQGTTMKNLMTQFIRSGLRDRQPSQVSGRARPLPPPAIPRQSDTPLTPPMSNRQLYNLLEEDDLAASFNSQKTE